MSRVAQKRNDIRNFLHASNVHEETLTFEVKPSVWHGAKVSQHKIAPISLLRRPRLLNPFEQVIIPLLALRTVEDLP